MECALGLFGAASLYALGFADDVYGAAYTAFADRTELLLAVRIVLVAVILLPPTILMGGTLPLFCRQYVLDDATVARTIGRLYGVNTLGAALGCALAGFVLLPALGLQLSVYLAAVINVLCGVAVWFLRITHRHAPGPPPPGPSRREPAAPGDHRLVVVLFFLAGFVALGNEVLWSRYLSLLIWNTVYTYTLTLAVVLVGIVLGSVVAARFFDRPTARAMCFGGLSVLAGLASLTLMMLPADLWREVGNDLVICFLALLPAAVLSGAAFPLAVRMVVEDPSTASLGVGKMAAVNTVGGILGSLSVGFVGLPVLGLQTSLLCLTGVSLIVGFVAWIWLARDQSWRLRGGAIAVAAGVWLAVPHLTGTRIPADFLAQGGELLAFREGYGSNLAVLRQDDVRVLEIDRRWQGDDGKNHQVMAAHVPMLLHRAPHRVLVVGVGTGQTSSRFLMYDVERLDCVDIEPTIFALIEEHFDARWMGDPRTRLIREDGRNYLSHSSEMYDVISLEVGQVSRPGVANFYTADFYQRARARLHAGGLLSQFVPLPFFTPAQLRSVLHTFLEIFPQSYLWYNTSELLLVGVNGDGLRIHLADLESRLARERIHRDLEYSHWGGPDHWLRRPRVFLASFLMGPGGLADLARGGRRLTDDLPVLDYATSHAGRGETHEQALVEEIRTRLEPVDGILARGGGTLAALPATTASIEELRRLNLGEMMGRKLVRQARLRMLAQDREQTVALLRRAIGWNTKHVAAHRLLGRTLAEMGRLDDALGPFQAAVAIDPGDANAQYGLARVLHDLGRTAAALPHYRAATRLDGDNATWHHNLAVACAAVGQLREAGRHFEQALRLRPDYQAAADNLRRVEAALGRRPADQ